MTAETRVSHAQNPLTVTTFDWSGETCVWTAGGGRPPADTEEAGIRRRAALRTLRPAPEAAPRPEPPTRPCRLQTGRTRAARGTLGKEVTGTLDSPRCTADVCAEVIHGVNHLTYKGDNT